MKNYIKTIGIAAFFMACALMPSASAEAATTYQTTTAIEMRLQALIAELRNLQAQLAALQNAQAPNYGNQYGNQQCYQTAYGIECAVSSFPLPTGPNRLQDVSVDLDGDFARIEVNYTSGRDREFVLGGIDNREDVIEFLADETGATRSQILAVIDWNGDFDNNSNNSDDIDSINVSISSGDARVRVDYDDNTTERFTINNETNHSDIVSEIADRLDMSESDVRDVIDWNGNGNNGNDDVDRIVVTIDESDNDATARVYYEDGDSDTFDYDEDDEDDIISDLADDLDMDESDVEDVTDFNYQN